MSIKLSVPVHRISQKEFHAVDELVTRMAFDIHNEFGRFCDEKIYQRELLHRCESRGIKGASEAEIRVSFDTFSKSYFIDLILDNCSSRFRNLMENLVKEWGAFLDSNLFTEAVTHFFGGEDHVISPIPIIEGDRTLGLQKVRLLNPKTSFTISATTKNIDYYRSHIKRFLDHTPLKAVQWVNFNQHKIEFRTVI